MPTAIATVVVRLRYAIVALWCTAAIAATTALPSIEEAQTNSLGDLVATDAEAIDAELRSTELFGFPVLSRTIVVVRHPSGLSRATVAATARTAARLGASRLAGLESIPFALWFSNLLGEPPFSREKTTTALTYLFFPVDIGPQGRRGLAERYAELHLDDVDGAFVGVTGAAPARAEQADVISGALPWIELATVALVLIALGLHFRALGAPLLTIVTVAVAYLVAVRVLGAAGSALNVVVPAEVEPVIVALLFGIVTDYSIFFLARYRARIAARENERRAAVDATGELLPIVFVAGLTVAAACATLALARLGFFQSFGPGLALSVLVALAVVTTLVPALLAIGGRRLFWPSGAPREGRARRGAPARRREWLLAQPVRRPLLVVVCTTVPLLALAAGLSGLEVGNRTITSLPDDSEPKIAYRHASEGFAPGVLSPAMLLVEDAGVTERRTSLRRLQRRIAARPEVAAVLGPREGVIPLNLGAAYSPTGDAARLFLVLAADPFGSRAIDALSELNDDLSQLLRSAGLGEARATLAGDTAISAETVKKSREDLLRVVPAATLVVFVILALFLRALVASFYLVLTSLLALAASLGLTVLVFQDLLGRGELAFYVPFAATVLLVALGSDYNVYLVGRIWSEARRRPLRQAVAVAGARAAGAITTAGVVLAASFAIVAMVPIHAFQELAFAVAAGLLIDAFVVRSLLAPALIALVGEHSSWPHAWGRR